VPHLQDHRIVDWLERGVLFLLVLYLCVFTMPRAWGKLNTDFPNYYMSARLAHEGYDAARINEWTWLQREKDHRAVDIRLIGLLPITPFSTLVMWPLTGLAPLAAKHIWLLVNLALLVPLFWMLRSMTGLTYQRIALIFALSYPFHRNLLFGQFYLFLLVLIVASCWAYVRALYVLAGVLIAIATACKVFPILFFAFFLQRRAWRALISGIAAGIAVSGLSVAVFGWNLHRTYLHEILPWTLHGEGMPPYATSAASISSVLEWSALLVASLAISTMPASYHFVLLTFPVCVLASRLLQSKQYVWLGALLIVYFGIGFPMPSPTHYIGPAILLYVPRLFLSLALLSGHYALMWPGRPARNWTHYAWTTAMAASVIFSVSSSLHLQRAVRQEYAYRLPLRTQAFLTADARSPIEKLHYIAFTTSGYHLVTASEETEWIDPALDDDLTYTSGSTDLFVERALSPQSKIVDLHDPSHSVLDNARNPMLSADGQDLAFVRDDHGRGQLRVRKTFHSSASIEAALTPPSLNIYEASYRSEKEYAFSATENGHPPQIYLTDAAHANAPLPLGESRYPALSSDGHWMAYSHLEHGMWNLWLRDQRTGTTRRVADVPCNQIQPSWEDDSKTLLYSTDCGRSLWFTAVARRRVLD
jgi:hypothetical protein